MYIQKYIHEYNEVFSILNNIANNNEFKKYFKQLSPIGKTSFSYPINLYKLGNGKKSVILMSITHGCEIVTIDFILEFILTVLNDKNYINYLNEYSFYIIPMLNPEGYIISTSNILENTKNMNTNELEQYATRYLKLYNQDDYIAKNFSKKYDKKYKTLMKTSTEYINDINIRNSVENILKLDNLDSGVLPIWSSNAIGVDPNANSIHEFANIYKQRKFQKFLSLRYNDIPTDKPSPKGYPGETVFDVYVPENIALYNYIMKMYNNGSTNQDGEKLIAFFSYHSTGGQIYEYPDKGLVSSKQYNFIYNSMKLYSYYTDYEIIDEKYKYGVMDYYRTALQNVATLTIELSKLNANPIGPFANIEENINKDFNNNIKAIFYTLENIKKSD